MSPGQTLPTAVGGGLGVERTGRGQVRGCGLLRGWGLFILEPGAVDLPSRFLLLIPALEVCSEGISVVDSFLICQCTFRYGILSKAILMSKTPTFACSTRSHGSENHSTTNDREDERSTIRIQGTSNLRISPRKIGSGIATCRVHL